MWNAIGRDVFSIIAKHIPDGRTAVRMCMVCRGWKRYVEQTPRLMDYIKIHYIALDSVDELPAVLSPNPLKHISATAMMNALDTIMWFHHAFNVYMIAKETTYGSYNTMKDYFYCRGEGCRVLQNTVTKDVMFVNNHYDTYSNYMEHCLTLANRITTVGNDFFPGTMEFRFISFPFSEVGKKIAGCTFHRGNCMQLIFKANGLTGFANQRKYLSKWKLPPLAFAEGRGTKRRLNSVEQPPCKEYQFKKRRGEDVYEPWWCRKKK